MRWLNRGRGMTDANHVWRQPLEADSSWALHRNLVEGPKELSFFDENDGLTVSMNGGHCWAISSYLEDFPSQCDVVALDGASGLSMRTRMRTTRMDSANGEHRVVPFCIPILAAKHNQDVASESCARRRTSEVRFCKMEANLR